MNAINVAIIKTLCYADVFSYPLTQPEIFRYLIWETTNNPPPKKDLISPLFSLTKAGQIAQTNGHFYLPGRERIVDTRKSRTRISAQKTGLAQEILQPLEKNSNILGVFLTGALAMNNADPADDIDILIITRSNKLWTTRLLITLKLQLKGHRRSRFTRPGRATDLICTNMYLDETTLTIPTDKQTLYTAHEVIQVQPIVNKAQIHQRFLTANRWINQYLPNFHVSSNAPSSQLPAPSLLETLAYHLQYRYMKRQITRETVTRNAAYFHPRDTKQHIMSKYQANLEKFLNHKS